MKLSHPMLASERASAPFEETAMTDFLNGGSRITAIKREIMDEIDELVALEAAGKKVVVGGNALEGEMTGEIVADAILPNEDHCLEDARLQTMKMLRFQYNKLVTAGSSGINRRCRMELMSLFDPAWFTRNGIHFGLWMSAIQGQGSMDQVNEWLGPTLMMQIIGCFGMTEIGHGSFVRGIETTATYDPATETFDIHTPRLEATKWWIGGAAKTSTHCAVFAQLILPDGSRPGVHTFIVQLRSTTDHSVLPGIRVGDCGAKFGRNGLDNGWIQFNHVKVDRGAMLCKYSQVDAAGNYTQRGSKQLQYGALIGGRAIMVTDSAVWLQAAVTISVRYLSLRTQGESMNPQSSKEPQLIDFKTVQTRVMPLVATAYALTFTSAFMQKVSSPAGLKDEDADDAEALTEEELAAALPDLHATCAGLKAFSTWACYHGIDTLRQCLGGHGYSGYTGLARMFADFAVQCTWEGDNTVMALQTARYLVSSFEKLSSKEERLTGSVSYLESLPRINRTKRTWAVQTEKQLLFGKLRSIIDAFRFLLAKKVERVSLKLRAEKKRQGRKLKKRLQKMDKAAVDRSAWNDWTPELLDCSRAHCYYVMSEQFVAAVERAENSSNDHVRNLAPSLSILCRLFMLHSLSNWLDWFVAMEYMDKYQMFLVKDSVVSLCGHVRGFVVPAVDAFALSDAILRSPLGRRDGNVYENYFQRVLKKPNAEAKPPYYDEHITPLLQSSL